MTVPEALSAAVQAHRSGEVERAKDIYQTILTVEPDHPDALHLMGVVLLQRGEGMAAADLIERAITRQPATAMYHNNLGRAYQLLGRLQDAHLQFTLAIQLAPDLLEAYHNDREVLCQLGRTEEAIAMLDLAIARRPDLPMLLVLRGQTLQKAGHPDEAVACYEAALASAPDKAQVQLEVAVALTAMGKHEEAIRCCERVIALKPAWDWAHLRLARLYLDTGRPKDAAECCRRALSISPGDVQARHMLDALEGNRIERAHPEYVREVFDAYAEIFDRHVVERLNYHSPAALSEMIRSHLRAAAGTQDILDLGCGTGLMGIELADVRRRMVGVDLSPNMLRRARERGVYDALVEGDITTVLADLDGESYDIVVAADVLVYLGDLASFFEECSRVLRPGGLLAFSTEDLSSQAEDYVLHITQRFKHSCRYVERLAWRSRFVRVDRKVVTIRMEGGQPVKGGIYLFARS